MKISSFENSFQLFNGLVNDVLPCVDEPVRPALTIFDHEDRYIIECDLPGMALDDISLEVHDGVLEISGERKPTELPAESSVRFDERSEKSFERRVKLDKSVDTTSISADYNNGVLVVTVPRLAETLPRKVMIRKATDA